MHGQTVLFVAGFLLLGAATLIVELRAKRAAKTSESYLSPPNGSTERVPARSGYGSFCCRPSRPV
jgi:hypothetical protein